MVAQSVQKRSGTGQAFVFCHKEYMLPFFCKANSISPWRYMSAAQYMKASNH